MNPLRWAVESAPDCPASGLILPSREGSFSFRAVLTRPLFAIVVAGIALAGCSDEPTRFTPTLDDAGSPLDVVATRDVEVPVDRGVIPIRDNGPSLDQTIVYAHSDSILYAVNPRTNALTRVGTFTFPSGDRNNHSMNDVAVDADGTLVGNTQDALYRINTSTAACSLIAPLPDGNFVGLTYLPAGLIPGSTGEVLVGGASNGTYWRIDATTGRSTRLGQLRRNSTTYALSGDIVSITGAGTFATVRASNASSTSADQLASMNPTTGELTILGNTGFDRIFGLAYYRNTLYGFTRDGEFISMNIRTGVGTLVSMPAPQFYGAGVTTIAPIAPP